MFKISVSGYRTVPTAGGTGVLLLRAHILTLQSPDCSRPPKAMLNSELIH